MSRDIKDDLYYPDYKPVMANADAKSPDPATVLGHRADRAQDLAGNRTAVASASGIYSHGNASENEVSLTRFSL
jgi:hypothetical protein